MRENFLSHYMAIQTSQDIFYIVLAVGIGMISITLVILLIEVIKTMKRVNRISGSVEDITDHVNSYVRLPSIFIMQAIDWLKENKGK